MKKIIPVLLLALSTSAFADEKTDWTGFYGSVLVGHNWGGVSEGKVDAFCTCYGPTQSWFLTNGSGSSIHGWSGNLKVGYNKQINANLIGAELGGTWQSAQSKNAIMNTVASTSDASFSGPDSGLLANTKIENYESLSARVGHIFNDASLVYFKAGVAVGQIKRNVVETAPNWIDEQQVSSKSTELGYLVGAGVEHKLNDKWALRADYEYVDFGTVGFSYNGSQSAIPVSLTQANSIHFSNLSAGVSYAF